MSFTGKLGTTDSQLGGIQLAFTGAPEQKPSTGTQTGTLGTADSLLGNMRPALGETEGGGGGSIIEADASSTLSLSVAASTAIARAVTASNTISLTSAAGRNNLPSLVAESIIGLTVDAGRNNLLEASALSELDLDTTAGTAVARAVAAASEISLSDEAGRNNLLAAAAESTLSVDGSASTWAVRLLTAENTLELSDEAESTGRTISEVAAESDLDLSVEAATTVVRLRAAANELALTSEAGRNNLSNLEAESTISLTSAAHCAQRIEVSAGSTISLESTAHQVGAILAKTAASDLSLTDEAVCTHLVGKRGDCEDYLELFGEATVSVVRSLSAGSIIELVQTEHTARPWYVSAESPVQIATPEYDPVVDDIVWLYEGLQDRASAARPLAAAARQSIPLHQSASAVRVKPTAIAVSAESVLELLGEVRINPTGATGNWLALRQTATADTAKRVKSALDLSQEAAVIVSVSRGAASALGLRQAATYSIVSRGTLQSYTPFVGEGPGPTPPSVTIGPPEHVDLPFRLFYPAEGVVTDSVTLRAPNLGNKDRLSFNRILRETRGGTLIVFADPIWPKIQTLVLTFSGLRSIQAQQLLAFLETHLGEEIGLLDWEGRTWKGIVTAPEEPVVQDAKDSFSASLEFEGELVPA